MDIERRTVFFDSLDVESRADGETAPIIRGHAALFDTLSEDLGGFREVIKPGAFRKAIEEDDVRALVDHEPRLILGRKRSGTLRLSEDEKGLAVEIDPPDTQAGRDIVVSIRRGDVSQMSFAFSVRSGGQSWDEDDENGVVRVLSDVRLYDVSPVTFPAYPDTDVAVREFRSHQEHLDVKPYNAGLLAVRRRALDFFSS